jgi:hypothetical protein
LQLYSLALFFRATALHSDQNLCNFGYPFYVSYDISMLGKCNANREREIESDITIVFTHECE